MIDSRNVPRHSRQAKKSDCLFGVLVPAVTVQAAQGLHQNFVRLREGGGRGRRLHLASNVNVLEMWRYDAG